MLHIQSTNTIISGETEFRLRIWLRGYSQLKLKNRQSDSKTSHVETIMLHFVCVGLFRYTWTLKKWMHARTLTSKLLLAGCGQQSVRDYDQLQFMSDSWKYVKLCLHLQFGHLDIITKPIIICCQRRVPYLEHIHAQCADLKTDMGRFCLGTHKYTCPLVTIENWVLPYCTQTHLNTNNETIIASSLFLLVSNYIVEKLVMTIAYLTQTNSHFYLHDQTIGIRLWHYGSAHQTESNQYTLSFMHERTAQV